MGKLEQEFAAYRERMNARILEEDNRVIKRVYSVDSLAYADFPVADPALLVTA